MSHSTGALEWGKEILRNTLQSLDPKVSLLERTDKTQPVRILFYLMIHKKILSVKSIMTNTFPSSCVSRCFAAFQSAVV
jgi:hypothetical protein